MWKKKRKKERKNRKFILRKAAHDRRLTSKGKKLSYTSQTHRSVLWPFIQMAILISNHNVSHYALPGSAIKRRQAVCFPGFFKAELMMYGEGGAVVELDKV